MLRSFPNERQLDTMDCGAACLKMIAKHFGKHYSLQFFRDQCGTNRAGASMLELSYAAENVGLHTLSVICTMEELLSSVTFPCIVHWDKNHYIVVYKILKNTIYVSDPAKGYVQYTLTEFDHKWSKNEHGAGTLMSVEPRADFQQRKNNERLEHKKTFKNIWRYFTPYKNSFINLFVVMLIVTALEVLLPFISKAVIDVGIQTQDLHFINIILLANILIILSMTLSDMVRDWILLHLSLRINIASISDYLIKLMKLPITFFETKMTGDILQRANDYERIQSFIMNNSLNIIFSTITFIVFGCILFTYHKLIFSVFLVGSILYVFWIFAFLEIRKKLDWEYFGIESKNLSHWIETIDNIQDIKLNNYEKAKRWKWETIQARLFKVSLKILNINNAQNSGAQFINQLKNLLITFLCARAIIAGEITFGVMISIQFIIGMLNGPVVQFIQFIIAGQFARISFLRPN